MCTWPAQLPTYPYILTAQVFLWRVGRIRKRKETQFALLMFYLLLKKLSYFPIQFCIFCKYRCIFSHGAGMFHFRGNAARSIVAISEAYATGSFSKRRVLIKGMRNYLASFAAHCRWNVRSFNYVKLGKEMFQVLADVYKQVLSWKLVDVVFSIRISFHL